MKITKFDTNHLRNDAHYQYQSDFRDSVIKGGWAEALKIKPQFDEWLAFYEKEDEAHKKISKSALTQQIVEADKARDDTYIGMVEIAGAYLRHHDPETREAARRLKIVFDTYGNVAKKPVKEQTAATVNILQELQGKYAADCATVKISDWVTRLAIDNEALNKLMSDRFDEAAAKTHILIKDARKQVDEAYRNICLLIEANILREGMANYETFVGTLNAVIAKYAVKHHRHHHGGNVGAENVQPQQTTGGNNEFIA
jgi:hypothetical protein